MKPGGYIEFQETIVTPYCDDGTMTEDDVMRQYYLACIEAMKKFGMDITKGLTVRDELERAGFVNINCVVKRVPLGTWPKDKTLRLIGQYARMTATDAVNLTVMGKPFAALGYSEMEREKWAAKDKQTLKDDSIHRYYFYYFWYGQKPE